MLHITPMIITAKATHQTADCATMDSTSGGFFNGSVIDRLALGIAFTHAEPFLIGERPGTTSTQGARYRAVQAKLRHGDSSGGGDQVDYMSDLIPAAVPFFTTQGESTDWKNWSTGAVRLQTRSHAYPLLGAKRFITAAGMVQSPGLTTATAAVNVVTVALGVALIKADQENGPEYGMSVGGLRDVLPTTATNT